MRNNSKTPKHLSKVIAWIRTRMGFLLLLSGVINVLALTGSFYMLQIYDRALTSQSVETLIALSVMAIGLYLFQGVLDVTRSQILIRIGASTDLELAPLAHRVAIDMPRFGYSPAEAAERGRDVDVLRQFISGQGPIALLDTPWLPVYLAFIYLLHPGLALLVVGGAVVLGLLTLTTEILTRRIGSSSQSAATERADLLDSNIHNSEVLRALGMRSRAVERYCEANRRHLALQMQSSDVGGTFSGMSKVMRMLLQSAVLGLGAYFTIRGEMSAGAIIAASVASARALAPIDQVIGQWKSFVLARRSYRRLQETLVVIEDAAPLVPLPAPVSKVDLEKITVTAPGSGVVVLSEVTLEIVAGQALGVIGPSGSGKSSLARAATGVWPLVRGSVRLDNADLTQWDSDQLGRHIGYLPQDVQLMRGTVAENICRFDPEADGRDIIWAAQLAGVHELILRLPQGYETPLGPNGAALSAGQRQRVALARAVYGQPFLIVLDEPNSNLDAEGEVALARAISQLRDQGSAVIVIAHRPSVLSVVDKIAVLQGGRLAAVGPRDEILGKFAQPAAARPMSAVSAANAIGGAAWAKK